MTLRINSVNNGINTEFLQNSGKIKENIFIKQNTEKDSFVKQKSDKASNGKFDISEAAKNFFKGIISPVKAALKHPLLTAGVLAATIAACSLVPVLTPIMTVGFLGASVFQLGKGIYEVGKNIKNGEYDKAETSFETVGQGTVGTALGVLGLKNSAQIAKEAKMMNDLKVTTLTEAQKDAAALELQGNSMLQNLKEITTLVTTKQGRQAVISQFKPSMIKARGIDFINKIKRTKEEKEITREVKREKTAEDFKKTPEGIRRAAMSDEEIEAEVQGLFDKAFDELGVPKEQRPKLKVDFNDKNACHGGCYRQGNHSIEYNPQSYREGLMEMDDVIMHEATHCKEALMRAGIPQDRVDTIVRDELLSRIQNGESEEIIVKGSILGADTMKPPKMSEGMKADFSKFAKEELYVKSDEFSHSLQKYSDLADMVSRKSEYATLEELSEAEQKVAPTLEKIRTLMKNHPEFQQQFADEETAFKALVDYSLSHNTRYSTFTKTGINSGYGWNSVSVPIKELSGEALQHAEESLVDYITTLEGNARVSGFKGMFATEASFNQYQFSPEEVLAQRNGNNFLIKNLTAKLSEMKAQGTLTPEDEAYLTSVIEKAKATIDFKTKGLEYYEQYTRLINNPADESLQAAVKTLEAELSRLKDNMNPKQFEIITEVIKTYKRPDMPTAKIPSNVIYDLISKLKECEQ